MGTSKKKAVVTPKKPKKKREKKRETESPSEEHRIVTVTLNEHTYTGYVKTNSIGKRCFDALSAKYQWKNGTQYEGPFVQSDIQGHGKYTWPDGSSYQGNLLNGRRHGHGVFLAADGVTKYDGQWQNGKRHGQGRLVYDRAGESFYEGEWLDGCKHGHGRQVWPSKNTYEGQWDQGRIHGFGTMTWSENGMPECYTGEWANDMPEGHGKYTWHVRDDGREGPGPRKEMPSQQSNNSFEGLWQKGLRSGYGTFNFASGAQYKGQWSENIKHGEGRYTYEDGRVYTGEFVMDNMAKDSTASEIPAEASTTQFLNVGGAENPVRRCIEINDLTGFCLPNDRAITDPTELTGYTDPTEVFREIYNILLRQVGDLKKVYAKVRRIIQRPGDDPWVMYAFQLWMLFRDTGMLTPECPLSRVNRYIMSGIRRHGEAFHEDIQELRPLTPRPSVMSSRDAKQGKASKENSGEATEATDEDDDYDDEEEAEAEDSFMHDEENEDDGDDRNSAGTRQSRVSRANSRVSRVSRGTNRTMGDGPAQPGRRPTIQSLGTRQFGSSGPMDDFFDQSKFWRLGDAEASEKILDVHSPTTALMFRHFLEALVRMAPAAYPENQGLESMLKALLRERFLPKVEQPIGVESCGTFEFLVDGQLQQVFKNFQTKLWELFKENTTGFGAYELPQWAHILDLDADEGSAEKKYKRLTSRHYGGTSRRVHIQGRMCVSIRVKDALHILNCANLLCIGSIQSCIDNPTGSVFTVQQEEPALAEPIERPVTTSSPGTTPIDELASLKGAISDMPSQTADSAPPINMDGLDPRSQTPAGESTATGEDTQTPTPVKEMVVCKAGALAEFAKLNFKADFSQVFEILTEVFQEPARMRICWTAGEASRNEGIALLDYLETELTFAEFQRLLLRMARIPAEGAANASSLDAHTQLEAFLEKVFLPAAERWYATRPAVEPDLPLPKPAPKAPAPEPEPVEREPADTAEDAPEGEEGQQEEEKPPTPEPDPPEFWHGFCAPDHLDVATSAAPRSWPEAYGEEVLNW